MNSDDEDFENSVAKLGYAAEPYELVAGDKFTKQPVWYGEYMFMLGRQHIHIMNVNTGRIQII